LKRIQPHIMCGIGDVAKYVFLPGDPKRAERIAKHFDEYHKVADYRQYITFTGTVSGIPVSVTSTGIGVPGLTIATGELSRIGADTFIRIGTTGTPHDHIEMGDLVIPYAALRWDGTTQFLAPPEYPAVATPEVYSALVDAAKRMRARFHTGIVASGGAAYAQDCVPPPEPDWKKMRITSFEMECSGLFLYSTLAGLRSGAILAIDGNPKEGNKFRPMEPGERIGELDGRVQKAIDKEIDVAIEAVKILERNKAETM
jgi:uridine phosphorylase